MRLRLSIALLWSVFTGVYAKQGSLLWIPSAAIVTYTAVPVFKLLGRQAQARHYQMPDEVAHRALEGAEALWQREMAVSHSEHNGGSQVPQVDAED